MRFAPTVHGARDHGFIALITAAARRHGVSAYVGDGSAAWSAVHRSDAARLVRLGLEQAPAGSRLHAVAEEGIPTRDIAAAIGEALGVPVAPVAPEDALEHFGFIGGFFAHGPVRHEHPHPRAPRLDADRADPARGHQGRGLHVTTQQTITLITGANKGLGRETARRLAEAGHTVLLGARDVEQGKRAADEIGAEFVPLDVTDDVSVAAAADHVRTVHGRLDVLVNNAGVVGPRHPLADVTAAEVLATLDTNLLGVVRLTHAFLPLLRASGNPRIVNVSSGTGRLTWQHESGWPQEKAPPIYSTSKAALTMLTLQYAHAPARHPGERGVPRLHRHGAQRPRRHADRDRGDGRDRAAGDAAAGRPDRHRPAARGRHHALVTPVIRRRGPSGTSAAARPTARPARRARGGGRAPGRSPTAGPPASTTC